MNFLISLSNSGLSTGNSEDMRLSTCSGVRSVAVVQSKSRGLAGPDQFWTEPDCLNGLRSAYRGPWSGLWSVADSQFPNRVVQLIDATLPFAAALHRWMLLKPPPKYLSCPPLPSIFYFLLTLFVFQPHQGQGLCKMFACPCTRPWHTVGARVWATKGRPISFINTSAPSRTWCVQDADRSHFGMRQASGHSFRDPGQSFCASSATSPIYILNRSVHHFIIISINTPAPSIHDSSPVTYEGHRWR